MNKHTKVKYEKICLNAIKNYIKEFENKYNETFSTRDDDWEMQYLYKKMFLEYGLSKNETKKMIKKHLTNN